MGQLSEKVSIVECEQRERIPTRDDIDIDEPEPALVNLLDRLTEVDRNIFAKVVATSKLASPGTVITERLTNAITYAERVFRNNNLSGLLAKTLEMQCESESESKTVCRVSALLLCNALYMHRRLKTTAPQMRMLVGLDKINVSEQPIGNLCDQWETILEVDYFPIFGPAISLLRALREHGYTDKQTHQAIHPLIECTNELADSLSELGYDHAGPLYHKILGKVGESDGAFYTNSFSAITLARLVLDSEFRNWTSLDSILELRMLDPACGTGTLLLALARTIKDRLHEHNVDFDESEVHRAIVENMICGLDINHHAIQLSGANLTLGAPTVDYQQMNLAVMKHGVDFKQQKAYCGSLELLDHDRFSTIQGLEHTYESLSDLGAEGIGRSVDFSLRDLDVVIMNPPYTNNTKRSKKYSKEEQVAIRDREKKITSRLSEVDIQAGSAIDYNAVASFFGPIADLVLNKKIGRLGLVSPTTSWIGASGREQRRLLTQRFDVKCVITNHNPNRPNFSENTDINESLVVLQRKNSNSDSITKFVSLLHFPTSFSEATEYANDVEKSKVANWGNISIVNSSTLNEEPWTRCAVFNSRLADIAKNFRTKYLYSQDESSSEFLVAEKIAQIEPAGQRTSDAFHYVAYDANPKDTVYEDFPLLWFHKTSLVQTLQAAPDVLGTPKVGKEQYAAKLWHKKSRLVIANRIDTTNVRVVSRVVDVPVLGGAWVPIRHNQGHQDFEQIWSIWLNSSFMIPHFLVSRSKKLTYPKFSLDQLRALPLVNPASLDCKYFNEVYNSVSTEKLLPWSQANLCPVRKKIDSAIVEVTSLEETLAEEIRTLVVEEPTVNSNIVSS